MLHVTRFSQAPGQNKRAKRTRVEPTEQVQVEDLDFVNDMDLSDVFLVHKVAENREAAIECILQLKQKIRSLEEENARLLAEQERNLADKFKIAMKFD